MSRSPLIDQVFAALDSGNEDPRIVLTLRDRRRRLGRKQEFLQFFFDSNFPRFCTDVQSAFSPILLFGRVKKEK